MRAVTRIRRSEQLRPVLALPGSIVRSNEHNHSTDVPHRLLVRGTIGLPGQWDFAPVAEVRSGFPWSAVNEFEFRRAAKPRGPSFEGHDVGFLSVTPVARMEVRFRGGIKVYNILGASSERDVQHNITSPAYGQFFNPIERSIGFVLGRRGKHAAPTETAAHEPGVICLSS